MGTHNTAVRDIVDRILGQAEIICTKDRTKRELIIKVAMEPIYPVALSIKQYLERDLEQVHRSTARIT